MSLAYFPMYPDDFEADTAHLTLAEDGAYNRLLRLCWRTPGCSLPADRAWIYRRMRAHSDEDKAIVDTVLEEFFTLRDGRVSNARLIKEWLAANDAHERRKNAGSKGGKTKSLKNKETAPSNAVAKPKQPKPEPEPYVREDANASSCAKPSRDEGFADFWAIWPDKKNKQAASKAWRKLSMDDRRAAFSAIRDGWFDQWRQCNPRAAPIHAATFLNQRRWEDQARPSSFKAAAGDFYDNRTHPQSRHSRADADARIIAFAGRAIRTPREDCF